MLRRGAASLLAAGGHVYASSAEGVTSVVRAGERFELVAVNELGEGLFPRRRRPTGSSSCAASRP